MVKHNSPLVGRHGRIADMHKKQVLFDSHYVGYQEASIIN